MRQGARRRETGWAKVGQATASFVPSSAPLRNSRSCARSPLKQLPAPPYFRWTPRPRTEPTRQSTRALDLHCHVGWIATSSHTGTRSWRCCEWRRGDAAARTRVATHARRASQRRHGRSQWHGSRPLTRWLQSNARPIHDIPSSCSCSSSSRQQLRQSVALTLSRSLVLLRSCPRRHSTTARFLGQRHPDGVQPCRGHFCCRQQLSATQRTSRCSSSGCCPSAASSAACSCHSGQQRHAACIPDAAWMEGPF